MSKNKKVKYDNVKVKNNMEISNEKDVVKTEERKSLDKVVSGDTKKVKRGLGSRLISGVLGPEGLPGIGSYVTEEIIVPAIKNIIVDAVTSGINMVMYGGGKGQAPRNHVRYNDRYVGGPRPTVNYTSRYTNVNPEPADRKVIRGNNRNSVDEYVIEDRIDAAHVLSLLTEYADMYGNVSVADYYDLIGVPSEYTDNNYGWTLDSITQASIRPTRGGFVLRFPTVEVL